MKQKLTLSPDTFLWRKGTEGLLYESARETMFHFNVTDSIRELCRVFEDYDNLYSASFDPETLDNDARSFINEITTRDSAGLHLLKLRLFLCRRCSIFSTTSNG